jgi:hypothetical protein
MRTIDLNKKRKARSAVNEDEPVVVLIGSEEFKLPAELPAEFAFAASEGDLRTALRVLFGASADDFFSQSPSFDDVKELVEDVAEVYGFSDLGESSASANGS